MTDQTKKIDMISEAHAKAMEAALAEHLSQRELSDKLEQILTKLVDEAYETGLIVGRYQATKEIINTQV